MSAGTRVVSIVVAAGSGTRLPGPVPKGLRPLGGVAMYMRSLLAFDRVPSVLGHVLVVPPERIDMVREQIGHRLCRVVRLVPGGARRQDSVRLGLEAAERAGDGDPGWRALRSRPEGRLVAVHDSARPFVDPSLIERLVAASRASGAAIPVVPVTDTVRELSDGGDPPRKLDRARLRLAQTPQIARLDWLLAAYRKAEAEGTEATDEGAALEAAGYPFVLVEGAASNRKITTPEEFAEAELRLAGAGHAGLRIGFGDDRHPRSPGRPFVLAGVTLDERDGPIGHSDGDPLSHALIDALLGAAGEGSIGELFPDSEPQWAGASGLDLLERAWRRLAGLGWRSINVDCVVIADSPRLALHVPEIRRRIAGVLGVEIACVSVKGKRAEGLGFEGSGDGVSCRAVALLRMSESQ